MLWLDASVDRWCSGCVRTLPAASFSPSGWRCRACMREYNRAWRASHPERVQKQERDWHAAHPDKRGGYSRKWRAANPERVRERSRTYRNANRDALQERGRARYASVKVEAFNVYGDGACACCGETELLFLDLDHVNGCKPEDRRRNFYGWLKKNGWPTDPLLQVLCSNCNQGRQRNGGACPHLSARTRIAEFDSWLQSAVS